MKRALLLAVVFAAVACQKSAAPAAPATPPAIVAAPALAAASVGAAAANPNAFVRGTVNIKPELASKIPANGTLFIFAKPNKGGGPPMAVHRQPVGKFPVDFNLTAADVMIPGMVLAGNVFVTARVTASGGPMPAAGDVEGATPDAVPVGTEGINVTIDTVR